MPSITAVVAQFPVTLTIRSNVATICSVLEQTQAGDLVLFPEGSVSGYSTDTAFLEQLDQHELEAGLHRLQMEAQKRRIHLWVGACVCVRGQWFNMAYGFAWDRPPHLYRKINLAMHERGSVSAGSELPIFPLNTPHGVVHVGVQICRELRFPEQWKWLAQQGAAILLHLNHAVGADPFVWRSHLISRAAETQRFVLSANTAAPKQLSPTLVVAPDGQVLGEILSSELATLRVELDLSRVSNRYLDQSRTDVISIRPVC